MDKATIRTWTFSRLIISTYGQWGSRLQWIEYACYQIKSLIVWRNCHCDVIAPEVWQPCMAYLSKNYFEWLSTSEGKKNTRHRTFHVIYTGLCECAHQVPEQPGRSGLSLLCQHLAGELRSPFYHIWYDTTGVDGQIGKHPIYVKQHPWKALTWLCPLSRARAVAFDTLACPLVAGRAVKADWADCIPAADDPLYIDKNGTVEDNVGFPQLGDMNILLQHKVESRGDNVRPAKKNCAG